MPVNTNITATATAPPVATADRPSIRGPPAAQRLDRRRRRERQRHARHPQQVRRVRPLQRLRQDADADQGDGEQGDRTPGPAAVPAAQPRRRSRAARRRRRASGRTTGTACATPTGGAASTTAGSPRRRPAGRRRVVPRRRAGQLAPGAQVEHRDRAPSPRTRRAGPAIDEVDPQRQQPDDAGEHERPAGVAVAPQHPAEHQADGDHEVGPVGRAPARRARRRRTMLAGDGRSSRWTATDGEHRRPQRERQAAVPRHRRQGDRRQSRRTRRARRRPSPPARPHGRARANRARMMPRCWSRPNVRSAARLCAEHAVPAGQHVQRPRSVEVQEVDVGDVAAGDALGEVEHEALFHRPAGEAVQPAQGDGDEHADQGEAGPRADGACRSSPQPARAAEHEGGRIVVAVAHGVDVVRRHRRSRSSTSCSTIARRYPGRPTRPRDRSAATWRGRSRNAAP